MITLLSFSFCCQNIKVVISILVPAELTWGGSRRKVWGSRCQKPYCSSMTSFTASQWFKIKKSHDFWTLIHSNKKIHSRDMYRSFLPKSRLWRNQFETPLNWIEKIWILWASKHTAFFMNFVFFVGTYSFFKANLGHLCFAPPFVVS